MATKKKAATKKKDMVSNVVYQIQGKYGFFGWETVTTENTASQARTMLADYNKNEPKYSHRIKKVVLKG